MVQEPEGATAKPGVAVVDQQPPSPTASTSSREETRATREKLKKTSIAGLSQKSATIAPHTDHASVTNEESIVDSSAENPNGARGRPAKKRSFEDLAKDDAETASALEEGPLPKSGHHKRMRSRDVNSGDHKDTYVRIEGDDQDTLLEESDVDALKTPGGPGVLVAAPSSKDMDVEIPHNAQIPPDSQPVAPQETTTSRSTTKVPPISGFANTSSASPFGSSAATINKDKPSETAKTTSGSAFASSGLSAFSSSDKSPFTAAAGSKSSLGGSGGFGGGQSNSGFGSTKSGFGNTAGFAPSASTFASGSSGFGTSKGFGSTSTFGTPKPFGAGTTSTFGSGGSSFGTGKAFTSSKKEDDDEDDEENVGDEDPIDSAKDDAQQDPRFQKQHIETGEDDEETHFSSRARLYFFDRAWKERGTGLFKLNVRTDTSNAAEVDPEAQTSKGKRKARLLMRADGTHRVILNSPIFKGMQFGGPDGSEPSGKVMHLQSLEEGKPVPLQVKIGKEEVLKELYTRLKELEAEA
ncbi:hypothetical protein LTR64_001688 [Lithohypha guttulata]|uniref:uncharacterized protein n=1 Tax=Lithohypha guttulata TaxID=1690604 RepID=UPI002DE19B80|nr:hypothetical protein LTR51_003882 [Lithohypha guttulata]